ncbi:hypothetical protein TFLX_03856 [Thermoflexales bacterium]|nr:hypothetical protein TFLX_03856 [Thermoflexales bacterium]
MTLPLRIHLLGEFRLIRGDTPLTIPSTPRLQSFLAYLILRHPQRQRRTTLAGLLDPNVPEARARHTLSQAVWQLRRSLPGVIRSDREWISLAPGTALWVDALEFERLVRPHLKENTAVSDGSVARADLQRACQLYCGDLLEGLYDEWLLVDRERWHEMYLEALARLVQLKKLAGHYAEALELATTLAHSDPLREASHREVMRLYCLLDRPTEALRQFATCREILKAELSVEPETETLALARDLATRTGNALGHVPAAVLSQVPLFLNQTSAIPLVGRNQERAELLSLVEGIFNGIGGLVLVEGEAGIGKTRLLQEVSSDARWRGAQVLWAAEEEQAVAAYGLILRAVSLELTSLRADQIARLIEPVWLQALCPLLPVLAARLPELAKPTPLDPAQELIRLREAIGCMLEAWARIKPIVLILEDLHWTSLDTFDMLTQLARQLSSVGVLIIGSYRTDEARAQLPVSRKVQALACEAHGRLTLARLDTTASSELIRRSLGMGRPAPLFENRLSTETGGNPLFILETLRALYEAGLLQRNTDGEWSTSFDTTTADYNELPLSPALDRVIGLRLARLSHDERVILNVAAVLGTHFDFALLDEVAEFDTTTVLKALGELGQRGLLVETAHNYEFNHARIREIVYADLAPAERAGWHRCVAQALEWQQPDRLAALAEHWTRGQVWDKAIRYHQLAATEATAHHAYATASEHLSAALALVQQASLEPAAHFDLLTAHESAVEVLGAREQQANDLDAMLRLAGADESRLIRVQQRYARLLTTLSRFDEAEAAARQALTLAEQRQDTPNQIMALLALGENLNRSGRAIEAMPSVRQAVALCTDKQLDPRLTAQAHHALGDALLGQCEYATAQAEIQIALDYYTRINDLLGQAEELSLLAIIQMEQGQADDAAATYRRAIDLCRTIGFRYGESRNLLNYGNVFNLANRVAEAFDCYQQASLIASAIGHERGTAYVQANIASLALNALGNEELARHSAESALAFFRSVDNPASIAQCLTILGCIAQNRGDWTAAAPLFEEALKQVLNSGYRWMAVELLLSSANFLSEQGQPDQALEHLAMATAFCEELNAKDWVASVLASRGQAYLALGQLELALSATNDAMVHLTPTVERAYRIPYIHYQVLKAVGQQEPACAALEQAHQLLLRFFEQLTSEQRVQSAKGVPLHRAILTAWEAEQPQGMKVRLPCGNAPTGRPLRDEEFVEVKWTIMAPEEEAIEDKGARRQYRLLRLLTEAEEQAAAPTVDDLAKALGVSRATIKRDLAALRRAGKTAGTRGRRQNEPKVRPRSL